MAFVFLCVGAMWGLDGGKSERVGKRVLIQRAERCLEELCWFMS